jgi:hypothetical protein
MLPDDRDFGASHARLAHLATVTIGLISILGILMRR